ncbi:MAG TPA: hypothetical protein VF885_09300 [Arthrobacter sp.]
MRDPLAPTRYVLAQNIKAGQKFVHGRGGKHWTATSDADTTNMRTHTVTGELLVAVEISFRGTPQGMRMSLPLDKIMRLISKETS